MEPSTISVHNAFENDVISFLPFMEVEREVGMQGIVTGVMMDDKRILLLKEGELVVLVMSNSNAAKNHVWHQMWMH
jgi:hypothetical protein